MMMTDTDNNTGYGNAGYGNAGDWNTGNWNTGKWNTGYGNAGDWNTGDYCTGFFNTKDCMAGAFNGPAFESAKDRQAFLDACPDWLSRPSPVTWVPVTDMTDAEKQANPDYKTTGGYLRRNDWAEEWRKAKATATPAQIQRVRDLPGYDAAVFTKITGLDLEDINAAHTDAIQAAFDRLDDENMTDFDKAALRNTMSRQMAQVEKLFGFEPHSFRRGC